MSYSYRADRGVRTTSEVDLLGWRERQSRGRRQRVWGAHL
jgi:hypothetical protein